MSVRIDAPPTVMGLQTTVDYEVVWDAVVVGELADRHGISVGELSRTVPVVDERSLLVALLAFVRDGAGGECFVADSGVVEGFARRMEVRTTLGGTCLRAALAMRILGVPSLIHLVSIDDTARRLLPPDCAYLCSAEHDTLDPHLILQFPRGAVVRFGGTEIVAPHPNRVIFANDPPARELVLSEDLGAALVGARRFMVSGFNAIQDPEVLQDRLDELKMHLRQLPADALVFYEDAGFHRPGMSATVRRELRGSIDVYSLNEDEAQAYLGRTIDLLDPDQVSRALTELSDLVGGPTVVLHTKYFAAAAGPLAEDLREALDGGVTMAATRYLHGDGMTAADHARVTEGTRHPDGLALVAGLADPDVVAVAAYLLETPDPTTIGLGDTFVGGFMAALALREDTRAGSVRVPEPIRVSG